MTRPTLTDAATAILREGRIPIDAIRIVGHKDALQHAFLIVQFLCHGQVMAQLGPTFVDFERGESVTVDGLEGAFSYALSEA